jgi:hypothetical protein
MSSEIIQSVAYDNYDDFQHFIFMFSQNFISLFWGLFNDKTDLRVMYKALDVRWSSTSLILVYPAFEGITICKNQCSARKWFGTYTQSECKSHNEIYLHSVQL